MWMKTYFIYKLGFNLQIDNALQELILFINPLSFLIPVLGISLFFREKTQRLYLIGANVVLTGILIANSIFYGFYIDFITVPVLFQAKNLGGLGAVFRSCSIRFSSRFFWIWFFWSGWQKRALEPAKAFR